MKSCLINVVLLLALFCAVPVSAAPWSGILDSRRAIDWGRAGADGGVIPNRTNQCGSVIAAYTGSASTINSAISNCSTSGGGVVVLGGGPFSLSSGIVLKSNVTLRGQGANSTVLTFTGSSSFYWNSFLIAFLGAYTGGYEANPVTPDGALPGNTKTWNGTQGTSGVFTKGATILNLAGVTGSPNLAVGHSLFLVQNNDPDGSVPRGGYFTSSKVATSNGVAFEGGSLTGHQQIVTVTNINGTAVTVTPGIYSPQWDSSLSPRAYWWGDSISNAGIEDFAIRGTATTYSGVVFHQAADCWASGISLQVPNGTRDGIQVRSSRNVTIQHSFIGPMQGGGFGSTTSYGIEHYLTSDCLVLNSIFKSVESPVIPNASNAGLVVAYNYNSGKVGSQAGLQFHGVGNMYDLFEGNDLIKMLLDSYHGNQGFITGFRNLFRDTGEANWDNWPNSRYHHAIGNVMAAAGRYQCDRDVVATVCDRYSSVVFRTGYPGSWGNCTVFSGVGCDAGAMSSMMRWGNWDASNNAVRWVASEVPSGDAYYPNTVPATQTLPDSFFLNGRPSWWSDAKSWPPVGPLVTSGDISGVGGHAFSIPAAKCYQSLSGNLQNFNAKTCYPSAPPTTVHPPQNLRVSA